MENLDVARIVQVSALAIAFLFVIVLLFRFIFGKSKKLFKAIGVIFCILLVYVIIQKYFMENFDILPFLQGLLAFSAIAFILGILMRLIMGKGTDLNKSVSSALGILIIYVVCILISINTQGEVFFAALPYIDVVGDGLTILKLAGTGVNVLCTELVKMIILSFIVGIVEDIVPNANRSFWGFLLKIAAIGLCLFAYNAAINYLTVNFPEFFAVSNVVLLILAIAFLATTVFRWIVGGLLGLTVNPIVGAIYGFAAKTLVGKKLFQSILTTIIMLLVVYVINLSGNTTIVIAAESMVAFLPSLALLIVVWFLFGKFI